LYVVRARG